MSFPESLSSHLEAMARKKDSGPVGDTESAEPTRDVRRIELLLSFTAASLRAVVSASPHGTAQPFRTRARSIALTDANASDINDGRAVKQRVGSWQRAEL